MNITERAFYNIKQGTSVWRCCYMERVILHSDCNNFYASVECLHRPELRNKAMAVGGDVEQRHGIILAKNQLAKKHGIKTGEALWQAKQRCKELIIVPPNFHLYQRFSKLTKEIYYEYSNQVESFGLDEAWIDVSGENGMQTALEISSRIKYELGITVSIGVSFNKIFAKLGSDYQKPDAITEITKNNFKEIVWPLPSEDLLYVGKATKRKLESYGIHTIGDIANTSEMAMNGWLGKWGIILKSFANGLDQSPVLDFKDHIPVKSVGNSVTAPRDLINIDEVKIILFVLVDSVCRRLREQGFKGKTVCIYVRDNDLSSFTRRTTLEQYTNVSEEITKTASALFDINCKWYKPVRSIGISVSNLVSDSTPIQTDFYTDEIKRRKKEKLDCTLDWLKNRFGTNSVQPAICLTDKNLSGFDPKINHTIHPVGYR